MKSVAKLVGPRLKALGDVARGRRIDRDVRAGAYRESFRFFERGEKAAQQHFILFVGIHFPDLPPPSHSNVVERPDLHWDGPVDWIDASLKRERRFAGTPATDLEAALEEVLGHVSAHFARYADNLRLFVAAGLDERALGELTALLERGIDPDTSGLRFLSPLIAAAGRDSLPSARKLIAAGANPDLKPGNVTASQYATIVSSSFFQGGSAVAYYIDGLQRKRRGVPSSGVREAGRRAEEFRVISQQPTGFVVRARVFVHPVGDAPTGLWLSPFAQAGVGQATRGTSKVTGPAWAVGASAGWAWLLGPSVHLALGGGVQLHAVSFPGGGAPGFLRPYPQLDATLGYAF